MTDLKTHYLGLELKNPLVAAASGLSKKVSTVKKMEDAGISAVVLYSLFEEQITHDSLAFNYFMEHGTERFAESLSYFPNLDRYSEFGLGGICAKDGAGRGRCPGIKHLLSTHKQRHEICGAGR